MRPITIDQSHQVLATLAVNTDWASVDFEGSSLQDLIVRDPKEAGKQFTAFLRSGGRVFDNASLVQMRPWWRRNSNIFSSVESDGTTGEGWIERLSAKGLRIGESAKEILLSPGFKPTFRVKYEVVIFNGRIFNDCNRTTERIYLETKTTRSSLAKLNAEAACLLCERFSNKDLEKMGLRRIVVVSDPILDKNSNPYLLGVNGYADACKLGAFHDGGDAWPSENGFALQEITPN